MITPYPPSEALILVAIMNNQRDFEIARLLGWYRIPLRSAPKIIVVDYLALYQTANFGLGKWSIEYIAPVRGHELTTRAELLHDEANHQRSNQEYFKISIGPLQRIPNPIRAEGWRRITFLYTTGEYFNQAKTINELVVRNEERALLWKALRERAMKNQTYQVFEIDDFDLNPEILDALLGLQNFDQK